MLKGFNVLFATFVTLCLALSGCGDESSNKLLPGSTGADDDNIRDIYVWNTSSPHAATLYDCALKIYENSACTLRQLPLLGMENPTPTVDDILDRLLVSDDWMGARFAELLEYYPDDMLSLFSGLTAIVIDDDIRPAFYSSQTGAIYLDPDYLWMTIAEKQTINPKADYRAGYSDPLKFRDYGYYEAQPPYSMNYGSLDDDSTRTIYDLIVINGKLLLHELAHVNDFLPRDSYAVIDPNQQVRQATQSLAPLRISTRLQHTYPLQSDMLKGLANVIYRGATPTEYQRSITADDVADEYMQDSAADMYAYNTPFEDLAMLFEITMMKKYWNMSYRIAIVTPSTTTNFCDTFISWSALNWIGDESVKARAKLVTSALLPEEDLTDFYQSLPQPTYMTNRNWCTSSVEGLGKIQALPARLPDGVNRYPEMQRD